MYKCIRYNKKIVSWNNCFMLVSVILTFGSTKYSLVLTNLMVHKQQIVTNEIIFFICVWEKCDTLWHEIPLRRQSWKTSRAAGSSSAAWRPSGRCASPSALDRPGNQRSLQVSAAVTSAAPASVPRSWVAAPGGRTISKVGAVLLIIELHQKALSIKNALVVSEC